MISMRDFPFKQKRFDYILNIWSYNLRKYDEEIPSKLYIMECMGFILDYLTNEL